MRDEAQRARGTPSYRQPMAPRDIRWSALAMDRKWLLVTEKEIKHIGVSRGRASMKEAQQVALEMCRSDGTTGCEIIATVVNQCLAISISPEANRLEYAFDADLKLSIDNSMRECSQRYPGCKPAYSGCFPN
jgi:Domain of unknown function (DUF4189)